MRLITSGVEKENERKLVFIKYLLWTRLCYCPCCFQSKYKTYPQRTCDFIKELCLYLYRCFRDWYKLR